MSEPAVKLHEEPGNSQKRAGPPLKLLHTFVGDTQAHLRESINLADQKAGFLFATVTAVLAYLHTSGGTQRWLTALRGGAWGFGEVLATVAVLGLVAGAVGALFVVVPRIRGTVKGVVASWAIARFDSPSAYVDEVLATEPEALTRAKLEHCWCLAQISRRKYQAVNLALWCSVVGLMAAVAYLAFSYA
jgi:hypothetical protein